MRDPIKIDDVMIAAFVDDQLDAASRETIINAMDNDEGLRNEVYDLRKAKDLIKLSYSGAKRPEASTESFVHPLRQQCMIRIAATIAVLAIGLSAGYAGYHYGTQENPNTDGSLAALTQQQDEHIILHITESDVEQFETTLAYTEEFLNKHKNSGKARIEVVANAGGIDLLRSDYPLSKRVVRMMNEHDNITFIACVNTINKLRANGIDPCTINSVKTDKAAHTHIIDRVSTG